MGLIRARMWRPRNDIHPTRAPRRSVPFRGRGGRDTPVRRRQVACPRGRPVRSSRSIPVAARAAGRRGQERVRVRPRLACGHDDESDGASYVVSPVKDGGLPRALPSHHYRGSNRASLRRLEQSVVPDARTLDTTAIYYRNESHLVPLNRFLTRGPESGPDCRGQWGVQARRRLPASTRLAARAMSGVYARAPS
jgi:hypothetical protein